MSIVDSPGDWGNPLGDQRAVRPARHTIPVKLLGTLQGHCSEVDDWGCGLVFYQDFKPLQESQCPNEKGWEEYDTLNVSFEAGWVQVLRCDGMHDAGCELVGFAIYDSIVRPPSC